MRNYAMRSALPGGGDLTRWQISPSGQFTKNLNTFREWDRNELPRINAEIQSGMDPGYLIAAAAPFFDLVYSTIPTELAIWDARALIQAVSFPISSVERHFQSKANQFPGVGKSLLPWADELLVAAGRFARKLARDSTYETWLWNDSDNPLSFTGDQAECLFRDYVLLTYDLQAESTAVLRPICEGNLHPLSADAASAYSAVAANAKKLCAAYRSFTEVRPDGEFRLPQRFFAEIMRQYYARYPVGGVMFSGTNAANIGPVISLDYQLGWTVPWYDEIAKQAFTYLTEEDLEVLREDMATPSVATRIYQVLRPFNYIATNPITAEKRWVVVAIGEQPSVALKALLAFSEAVAQNRKLTAIHWSLIHAYLIRAARIREDSPNGADRAPHAVISHEKGTGGRTHGDTKAIMEMRLDKEGRSPLSVLVSALEVLLAARSA